MSKNNPKAYDLEERTFQFAKACRSFVKQLPRTVCHLADVKQLIRSFGSVGANYIEANDSIGKKDFVMKIKTCRREAKESVYWLRLLEPGDALKNMRQQLVSEAVELMKIFGSIVRRSEG